MPRFQPRCSALLSTLLAGLALAGHVLAQDRPEAFRDFRAELLLAIEESDLARARQVIQEGGAREVNRGNPTPLATAALLDNLDMVALLLNSGGDPNVTQDSPLQEAVRNDSINMVRLLFQAGAKLRDAEAEDLLRVALRGENALAIYRELLNRDVEVDLALREAVESRKYEAARFCLERGADISTLGDLDFLSLTGVEPGEVPEIFELAVRDDNRDRALSYFLSLAAAQGNRALADLALAQGADVSLEHLQRAEEQGQDEIASELLELMDEDLSTLIERAEAEKRVALAKYLKGLRADRISSVVGPIVGGVAALFVLAVIAFFLRKSVLQSPKRLYDAVSRGDWKRVEKLLQAGADPNARHQGETLLAAAAKRDSLKIARTLLRHGADVDLAPADKASDEAGLTPLHLAARRGSLPLAEVLLRHGAHLDARTPQGLTPLFLAAGSGRAELVNLLIERGADLNARIEQQTLLFTAVVRRQPRTAMTLLEASADPNADPARSPLHAAAAVGDAELVTALLGHGADPHAVDPEGRTPYDLALYYKHAEAAQALQQVESPAPAVRRAPAPMPSPEEGTAPDSEAPVFDTIVIPAPDPYI